MTLIDLAPDDLHFIVSYDPERGRPVTIDDLVAVIEEIQALVNDGVIPTHQGGVVSEKRPPVVDIDPDEKCPCGHKWGEHNVFNDCLHEDRRTRTGYCEPCPR